MVYKHQQVISYKNIIMQSAHSCCIEIIMCVVMVQRVVISMSKP